MRWAGLLEEEVGGANDPVPLSAAVEVEGGGRTADDDGMLGLVSTTTAVGPCAPGVADCSSGLLDPASSRDGQPIGSVFLLSRSSSAFKARCLNGW